LSPLSTLYRTKEEMTVAQLTPLWARELANEGEDSKQWEQGLLHLFMDDCINGRLDNAGPFRDGQRSALRLITPENKAGIIDGRQLREFIGVGLPPDFLDRLLVLKEAALDFARRRQLPPPSWWTDYADTPTTNGTTGDPVPPIASVEPQSLGKRPRIREFFIEHYPEGVPDPAHSPRKALKHALIEWDRNLSPLDYGTLKKAIDEYNASLAKPGT
jgi:hypothetical protein